MNYEAFRLGEMVWLTTGFIVFIYLLFRNAPYGRHITGGWGPVIDNRLGWIMMESVVLVVVVFFLIHSPQPLSTVTWFCLSLFFLHYLHRSFIYPLMTHTRNKKMPLIIALSAIGFNLINGTQIGYYFTRFAEYPADWWQDPRFIAGLFCFLVGAYINIRSDYYLIQLRKPSDQDGYRIPRGFLFDKVSCPNHFGEMIEWLGFAILTWSLPATVFFAWTCYNLVPRALAHHRWYQTRFPDYPPERKAVIPYLL